MKVYKPKNDPLSRLVWFSLNGRQATFDIIDNVLMVSRNSINIKYDSLDHFDEIGLSPDQQDNLNHALDEWFLDPTYSGPNRIGLKYTFTG